MRFRILGRNILESRIPGFPDSLFQIPRRKKRHSRNRKRHLPYPFNLSIRKCESFYFFRRTTPFISLRITSFYQLLKVSRCSRNVFYMIAILFQIGSWNAKRITTCLVRRRHNMSCDGGMKGSRHRQQNEFIYSVLFRIRPCVFLITLQMKKLQFLDKERRTKARIWQKKVFADVAGIHYFLEKHTRFLFRHDL